MNTMLILIGLTGITMIGVRGVIFHSYREWLLTKRPHDVGYLVNCPQCLGFWVGLFGGLFYADLLMVPLYAGAVSLLSVWAGTFGDSKLLPTQR